MKYIIMDLLLCLHNSIKFGPITDSIAYCVIVANLFSECVRFAYCFSHRSEYILFLGPNFKDIV